MQLTLLLFIPNIMSYFFRAQGRNQRDLVEQLVRNGVVSSPEIRKAMEQVNRKNYVNDDNEEDAYIDTPLPIGCGQTISAPHMHATALEQMLPYLKKKKSKEEEKKLSILDVGCGSGYLTAALGRLVDDSNGKQPIVGKGGKVYGIDVYPDLVDMTRENIHKEDGDLLKNGIVEVDYGDGWKGLPDKSPFDAIHVGAAADHYPTELMMQLRVGGALIVPLGVNEQAIYKIERLKESPEYHDKDFVKKRLFGVRYVPLVHTD